MHCPLQFQPDFPIFDSPQQPYTINESTDTRNIACVLVSVVVQDVQDEAPVFTKAPPVSRIPATAVQVGATISKLQFKNKIMKKKFFKLYGVSYKFSYKGKINILF